MVSSPPTDLDKPKTQAVDRGDDPNMEEPPSEDKSEEPPEETSEENDNNFAVLLIIIIFGVLILAGFGWAIWNLSRP